MGFEGEKKQSNSPNSINRSKGSRWVPEEAAGKNQELPVRMKHHQALVPSELQGPGIPTFPWEQLMPQVMAMPEIFGLQGESCRWCFQKGFSKKSPAKGVLGKGLSQRGLLNRVFQKDFVKNILQRGWVQKTSCKGVECLSQGSKCPGSG